jgi:hypothetical protein
MKSFTDVKLGGMREFTPEEMNELGMSPLEQEIYSNKVELVDRINLLCKDIDRVIKRYNITGEDRMYLITAQSSIFNKLRDIASVDSVRDIDAIHDMIDDIIYDAELKEIVKNYQRLNSLRMDVSTIAPAAGGGNRRKKTKRKIARKKRPRSKSSNSRVTARRS